MSGEYLVNISYCGAENNGGLISQSDVNILRRHLGACVAWRRARIYML